MLIGFAGEAGSGGIRFNLKPLDGSRKLKMKTGAVFRFRYWRCLSKLISDVANLVGLTDCIRDTTTAIGRRKKKSISDGFPEFRIDGSKTVFDPQQTADITGVTIGIPTGCVRDHESTSEVVLGIKQAENDDCVIRDHMAVAREFVVSVSLLDPFPGQPPIVVLSAPIADIIDQLGY